MEVTGGRHHRAVGTNLAQLWSNLVYYNHV